MARSNAAIAANATIAGALLHVAATAASAAAATHQARPPLRNRSHASPVSAVNSAASMPLRSLSHANDSTWIG